MVVVWVLSPENLSEQSEVTCPPVTSAPGYGRRGFSESRIVQNS